MLQFFRKYQKYFFAVIAVVTIFTFVFFGTYQAVFSGFQNRGEEKSYVGQMVDFLNTEQWMVSRRFFDANYLNDGVISKEFLETGMGAVVAAHLPQLNEQLAAKWEKEKTYTPYEHPFIPTLKAEALWSIFAPDLPEKLKAHQKGSGCFKDRANLLIAQKKFPPALLSQVIRYQEQNSLQTPLDPRLAREDLPLFGYHSLSDWFAEPFVEAIANHIITIAQKAKKLGYRVSKEEVLAELIARSQQFYDGLKHQVELPVHDGYGLFQLYVRTVGMSEESIVKIWSDISLFRRLIHSVGDAALIDPIPLNQFHAYAYENAVIELYQMPQDLRLHSMEELKHLEAYLTAVGTNYEPLNIPLDYASLATIEQRAPELVGKRYRLGFASITKKGLQPRISTKEVIQWECDPIHWNTLQQQFPELAQNKGEPFEILEGMEGKGRKLVDAYARQQIVEAHPEWINKVLNEAQLETKELFLTAGKKKVLAGIEDPSALAAALEQQDDVVGYTEDGVHFYRFKVEERGNAKEILSYQVAKKEGMLAKLVETIDLTAKLEIMKAQSPAAYRDKLHLYRFVPFLTQFYNGAPNGELAKQFNPTKQEKNITRSESGLVTFDEVEALEVGSLSSVTVNPIEGPYCYRFVEKKVENTPPMEKILEMQELLSQEARCHYFAQLISNK